ncbi:hypothetical protein SLE2022_250760 [Rubroshorea leprosula]
MRIVVAIRRVVDYAVKVRVKPDKTGVETHNVKMSMNPFCEIALEEALRRSCSGLVSSYCCQGLEELVGVENPGLLILGKQSIDDDCNQTGQMLAWAAWLATGNLCFQGCAGQGETSSNSG